MGIAREMLASVETIAVGDLMDRFVAATPTDGNLRDRRRRNGMRALDSLLEMKLLVLRTEDTLALTNATQASPTEFKKENE